MVCEICGLAGTSEERVCACFRYSRGYSTDLFIPRGDSMSEQNFSNHTKFVPMFHFFVGPILIVNFLAQAILLVKGGVFTFASILHVLVAAALLVLAFLARLFALGVQDRVIRLEERMRYEKLLPADLQSRIGEFNISQLVSLRFSSDTQPPP